MKSARAEWRPGDDDTDAASEVLSLRRTLRDVVALSALPSIWVDYDLPRSLQNLTDVLRAALRAYTVCVRVKLPDGADFSTAASSGLSTGAHDLCHAAELLEAVEEDSTELFEIAKFNGSGPLNALSHPLFFGRERIGHFVACYKVDVIPSQSDRLLLQVAANQVTLLFQRHKDQEERFARRLAEDRLRQTEHHHQQLVQSLPAAVYTCDTAGRITLYNEAAVKLWGLRPKIGEDMWYGSWKYFRPDGSAMPADERPMAIAIREGRSVRGQEMIVQRPDGSRAWVLPHPDPIRDESGKIVGFVNMLVQIDELKRAEQAARANEAHVESLLTLMPAAVYACDAEGRFTFYNRRAVELWGWEPKLNDNQQKFCATYKCWFNGKQIPPEETPMAVAVREGKAFRNLEPTIERPDGTRLSVLVNIDPIFDSEGKPAGAINVFQDVTPLKRVQEELRSREEHLRAIVENTPECVKLVAQDGTLLGMNGAGLCMIEADSPEQVIGKNVYDVIAPEYRSAFRAMNESVCAGNKERLEFEIIGLKGTRRWMETHAAPIVDPASGRTVQVGVTRNVTERRNAVLDLRRKNKQLAAFLETAALGLHRVGPDGTILWANDAEMKLLGYSPEEYIGHHIAEFHADQPVIDDILKRLSGGEMLCEREARLRCKDGSIKHVLIDSSVLWEDGKFIHTQCFTRDITDRKHAESALRQSEALLQTELADSKLLQAISAEIVSETNIHALNEKLVGAAAAIMHSDFASMQMYHPDRGTGELKLIALRGFEPEAARTWEWVSRESPSSCGEAMRRHARVIGTDVEKCEFLGVEGLAAYRAAGIGSMQSTPLLSRSGELVGMLSTQWRKPHEATERELRLFDILARLAADVIERRRAEMLLHGSNALLESQKDAFQAAMRGCSLEESLEILTCRAIDATGGRARAAFYITSADGKALHHVVGMHEHYAKCVDGYPVSGESMACGLAVHTGEPVIARDVEQDPRWEAYRWLARQHNFRACWSFPVRTKGGPVLGTLAMYFPEPCEPTVREMDLASVIAHAATLVISRHQQLAERERAELALRETNERLKKVLEIETVGVMFWDLTKGCLIDANDTFLKMMGYSRADVESHSLTWQKFTPPEYHDISRAEIEKFATSGRVGPYEKEYFHKSGTRQWLLFAGSSLGDNLCVEFCVDISERKRAEEGAARLAAIVEHSDDAIFSTDLDGVITSWNRGAVRLYGYSPGEAIGQAIVLLVPEDRRDEESRLLERIREGHTVESCETVRRRKDGTLFDVSLTISPVKDSKGKVIGISKVARDITDKVRAREKLEQTVAARTASLREAVEQMEEFSYSVSHDLRGPLRAMNAYAGVLLEEYGNHLDDVGRGYLTKIQRGSDRMNRLTQDVLAYSRVARSQAQPETIDLERLVRDVICQHTTLQPPAAEIEIVGSLPPVLGHETTLAQSVSNLLNNAVKFVAPGVQPHVRVRAERNGKQVRVWFEDNGIGIKPEHQQRIFNMFERVHPDGMYEGTGIGLTIVRKAMEKMGGKVGIQSDGHNGSSFWIELLRAD